MTHYTDPRSVFPAPIGAVVRFSVGEHLTLEDTIMAVAVLKPGKPLTDTVTGYAVKTFGATEQWTNVPCYVLATYGAWPVRDCEVVR